MRAALALLLLEAREHVVPHAPVVLEESTSIVGSLPRQNELRAIDFAQRKMEEWYVAAGAIKVVRRLMNPPGVSTHAYGGTRMGDNAETNVVNRWGFSHEVPNLGILGASVMGTTISPACIGPSSWSE